MEESLEIILQWMMAGGVQNVSDTEDVFAHAMLLARYMEKNVNDFYTNCSNPNTACHKWHYRTEDGALHVHSGTL
jgi:hypothetical protein